MLTKARNSECIILDPFGQGGGAQEFLVQCIALRMPVLLDLGLGPPGPPSIGTDETRRLQSHSVTILLNRNAGRRLADFPWPWLRRAAQWPARGCKAKREEQETRSVDFSASLARPQRGRADRVRRYAISVASWAHCGPFERTWGWVVPES